MSKDEIGILVLSIVAGGMTALAMRVSALPRAYTEENAGIGIIRLAVAAAVLWTAFVIQFFGDPSIEGVYVAFYLIIAYAVTKLFGQALGANLFVSSLLHEIYERKNLAGALFLAAFILATGILFGGSLWGEADPLSDAEGGWWIPLGFFFLGWLMLVVVTALYLWREPGRFRRQICQERDTALAGSAAIYVLSSATIIFEGVSGDFWGWRHGLLGMGTIAVMLVGHELLLLGSGRVPGALPASRRLLERYLYIVLAAVAWLLNRMIDQAYIGG